jgi:branched-chain amino acid transport system permease protein
MNASSIVLQVLTGFASASALFLVASGLSLIFGVTRIVNFAHGSFYMLGLYGAVALTAALGAGPLGFWASVLLAALAVAALGALIEALVLRRLYGAPELYQLLATFALVLIVRDAALWAWGPEDLLGPKAPGMRGAVAIAGEPFQSYDVFLIFVGPLVLSMCGNPQARGEACSCAPKGPRDGSARRQPRWLFRGISLGGTFSRRSAALECRTEPPTSTSTWR